MCCRHKVANNEYLKYVFSIFRTAHLIVHSRNFDLGCDQDYHVTICILIDLELVACDANQNMYLVDPHSLHPRLCLALCNSAYLQPKTENSNVGTMVDL